jgi:CheY-like chemotaxis protein
MSSANSPYASLRALIVEDSPTQALIIRQRVLRCGFSVRLATNGQEALALVEQELPTIVLTDLEMPIMDGLELVKQLTRRYDGLPVLVMTAKGSEEVAVQSLKAGAAGYVSKAKLEQELPKILESILAIIRANQGRQPIGHCLTETGSHYRLPNDLALIPPLVNRLQHNLDRLQIFDQSMHLRIGMALREALVNAVEHGNLEADSELRETDDSLYRQLVAQRCQEAPYNQRQVTVTARESRLGVTYIIGDDGPGFDPASLPDPTDPANLEKTSGRGLLLMRSFMDEVSHNASGNEITLVKYASGKL